VSEPLDPLEAELAALRPREASAALRQRLADHISRSELTAPDAPRWPWRAALAAAGVLLALNLWLALDNQRASARSAREREPAPAWLRGRELDLTEALLAVAGAHLTPRPDPVTLRHWFLLAKDDDAWDTH
jgi:hypothetical protein